MNANDRRISYGKGHGQRSEDERAIGLHLLEVCLASFFALFCVFRGEYCIVSEKQTKKERQAKGEKSLPPEKEGELESFIISEELGVFLTLVGIIA